MILMKIEIGEDNRELKKRNVYSMLKNNIKHLTLFLMLFYLFSQTHTITGVVSDDINKPLESANVLLNP
jgi:hypothetical protein